MRSEESVQISDAIRLLEYLFLGGARPPCLDAADADDSGTLTIADAIRVLNFLFLGGDAPPEPGPSECGVDPTEDAIGCDVQPGECAP